MARSLEERKNLRRAIGFGFLTLVAIIGFLFYGLPIVARISTFFANFKKADEPVDVDDTTPPAPPRMDIIPEVTSEEVIQLVGFTEEGATVFLYLNGKEEELIANKDGEFTFTFNLRKGENTFSAKARDKAGNESQETEELTITQDAEPPEISVTSPSPGKSFFGSKERQINIEGRVEEDSSLLINERVVVVDSSGAFVFSTTLSEGENTFTLKATDLAGNETEEKLTVNFTP